MPDEWTIYTAIMLWIKAFHIIFVICWFAGIFYLPRLLVNHAEVQDAATQQRLLQMEQKLFRFITPFAVIAIILGCWLALLNWPYYAAQGWFWLKLVAVGLVVLYHWQCGRYIKVFAEGKNIRSHVFFRVFNELPVFALFLIVILVVVKPQF